jgi:Lactate racemase N-terminal domain
MRVHCHVVEVNLVIATGPIRPHGVASVAAGAKAIDPGRATDSRRRLRRPPGISRALVRSFVHAPPRAPS